MMLFSSLSSPDLLVTATGTDIVILVFTDGDGADETELPTVRVLD